MTDPTPRTAATARDALLFLSTYEKDPPEVMKDDYAYDRLLAFVHDVAARALAAAEAPAGVSVERVAKWLHDNPAGEALHEDQWAMRFPAGTEGKGAECRPCRSVAAALVAHLRGPR